MVPLIIGIRGHESGRGNMSQVQREHKDHAFHTEATTKK